MPKIIERRKINVIISKNGDGYKTSKISIPMQFFKSIGITEEEKVCDVTLYDNKIEIKKGK